MFFKNARIFCSDFQFHLGAFSVKDGLFETVLPETVPEDAIDHVFERFYRVDKSHSNEIDGTGLGLAIVKSAVLVHKGAVRVTSHVGEGTTFSVRIPLNYIAG